MGRLAIAWWLVSIGGCAQVLGIDDRVIDAASVPCVTMYDDNDGDGHGNPYAPTSACDGPPPGAVASNDDCSPTDSTTYPGALERCDDVDNNCDTVIDENACPAGCSAARRPPPYYDRIYLFCAIGSSWVVAEQSCVNAGGHLTAIEGQGENDFVASVAATRLGPAPVWIGGIDFPDLNKWHWVEPPTQFSIGMTCNAGQFCNWATGQPNNTTTTSCVELGPMWNDQACTYVSPYVCRI